MTAPAGIRRHTTARPAANQTSPCPRTATSGRPHNHTCDHCRTANNAYELRRRRLRGYGKPATTLIDAAPTQNRLRQLAEAGMTLHRIATLTGLPERTVRDIHNHQRIRPATAQAVLAVAVPVPTFVPAAPVWKLIHGMVAQGYPLGTIDRMLGGTGKGLSLGQTSMRIETARRVKTLADKIAIRPGPSDKAREFAAQRGWKTAWLWEDLGLGDDDEPTTTR